MQELHRDSVHQRYCFSTRKYKQELRLCVMTQTQIKRKTQIDEINGITPLTCSILITRRRVKKQVRAKNPDNQLKTLHHILFPFLFSSLYPSTNFLFELPIVVPTFTEIFLAYYCSALMPSGYCMIGSVCLQYTVESQIPGEHCIAK